MKTMITGAAGFIGSQLAYRLWKDGNELILIDNFSYGKMDNLEFSEHNFKDEIIRMDIRDKEGIAKLLSKGDVEYIYNIAGIAPLPDCQTNPQEAIDVNTIGFVNLLENARKYGVKKVIQASTNAMYENEREFPTKENKFELPTLIYPNTKYCAERFAQSYCDTYDMSVTCLRFANVYGPHIDCLRKQPPFVAYMIRELFYDRIPIFHSDGNQRRDYIYVDDLIDLAIKVQNRKGFDCVNVSSNFNYSVNELYQKACEIMNKDIKPQYADDSHYWEKYPELFTGAYSIKEQVLEHEIKKYTLCDNSYAKTVYNWSPKVSIDEGLRIVIENECELLKKIETNKKKIHLIMPMGGEGSRFFKDGFMLPKPLIEIKNRPFFYWATQSIKKYVDLADLTFVVLKKHVDNNDIDKEILKFFPDAKIVVIPEVLDGAVLTCLEGIKNINDDYPVVFNDCDHIFSCKEFYKYCNNGNFTNLDGALLSFTSNDPKFSFLKTNDEGNVIETVEKVVISDKAICGVYFFKNKKIFENAAKEYLNICNYSEFYLSGVYNIMAKERKIIKSYKVESHLAFGTPEEYNKALSSKAFEELL